MPLIDMPLDELERYEGRNPRPDDFDEYWDRALAELDATPEEVSIERAAFETQVANAFDIQFTGVRGARIYSKLPIPKNAAFAFLREVNS